MSPVLVTGGAGFIGSHLSEELLRLGHDVRVLDNFATGRREQVGGELLEGDVRDAEAVRRAVAGCEVVFHLAALPSVPRSLHDPLATHTTNATGTLNVLLAAREHGVRRVVLASSSSVYGAAAGLPQREDGRTLPVSPYATSKLAAEGYARTVLGVGTVALRYFNVFGPRQDPRYVVPSFIAARLEGRAPVIHGDGEQSRDFTYVADAVRATLLAVDAPGPVYNVAGGERVSLLALLELLGVEREPRFEPPRAADMRHTHADLTLARAELGYEPLVGLRDGLARTVSHHAVHA
jgi:UDP-glucose 4-epimerase